MRGVRARTRCVGSLRGLACMTPSGIRRRTRSGRASTFKSDSQYLTRRLSPNFRAPDATKRVPLFEEIRMSREAAEEFRPGKYSPASPLVNVVVRDRGELDRTKTEVEYVGLGTPFRFDVIKQEASILFRRFPTQEAGIFQD